jgi:hypothetical protein
VAARFSSQFPGGELRTVSREKAENLAQTHSVKFRSEFLLLSLIEPET